MDGVTFGLDGRLYGVTKGGGTYGRGIVYSLMPGDGASFTVIDNLSFGNGGAGRLLVAGNGVVHGVTKGTNTGTPKDYATVFALVPPAAAGKPWTERALGAFSNGDCPSSGLIPTANGFLGVTAGWDSFVECYGYPADSYGSVYAVKK